MLDSLLIPCELRGVVHGFNTYPSGLRFTIIDPTSGIEVWSPVENFNYLVQEGDSVRIRGSIQQFLGRAQIVVDTLILSAQEQPLQAPQLVNVLDESTESDLIRLKCVELVNPNDWTNALPQFEVYVSTGADLYKMVIDGDTDLFGTEAPEGVFGVTGIGGQRDDDAPFLDGYTILPRGHLTCPSRCWRTFLPRHLGRVKTARSPLTTRAKAQAVTTGASETGHPSTRRPRRCMSSRWTAPTWSS